MSEHQVPESADDVLAAVKAVLRGCPHCNYDECEDGQGCCYRTHQQRRARLPHKLRELERDLIAAENLITELKYDITTTRDELNHPKPCHGQKFMDARGCNGCPATMSVRPQKIFYRKSLVVVLKTAQGRWQADHSLWDSFGQKYTEPVFGWYTFDTALEAIMHATHGLGNWELSPDAERILGRKMSRD